jgi:hypothetical protein
MAFINLLPVSFRAFCVVQDIKAGNKIAMAITRKKNILTTPIQQELDIRTDRSRAIKSFIRFRRIIMAVITDPLIHMNEWMK